MPNDKPPSAKEIWAILWAEFHKGSKDRPLSPAAKKELQSGRGYLGNIQHRAKKANWWKAVHGGASRCARRAGRMSAQLAGPGNRIEQVHVQAACMVLEWETARMKHDEAKRRGKDFDLDLLDGVC